MQKEYRIRVNIFIGVIVVTLSVLGLRLAHLQIVEAAEYTGRSQANAIRERRALPARGAIYDRNERLMVDNAPAYTIMLTPRYFDESTIPLLADLLGVSDSLVTAKLQEARDFSPFQPSRSFREVPFERFSLVQEEIYRLPGVTYEIDQKRRYPGEARAGHVLGYIREVTDRELADLRAYGYRPGDLVGKNGLERRYEEMLRGRLGADYRLVNVHGLEVEPYLGGSEDVPPKSGYDLILGLDQPTQALAESLFVGKRGGAVAIDPNTGEVLAMVSHPDYDPALFTESITPETWNYLNNSPQKPLFNRATQMGKPPGSTWKPFMALMGLDLGVISEDFIYTDRGGYQLGGRFFRNHASHVYGQIDVVEAIRVSSNAFFFNLMMMVDVDTFKEYATMFGFGVQAPIDMGEQAAGLIPDSSYYNRVYGRWTAGYSINLGIGQGDMVVTPLQLARYTAAVANEGTLVTPHLVRKLVHPATGEEIVPMRPPARDIPIAEEHFELVKTGMREVMEAGTGYYVQIPGIPSGGKTGTSQNPHGEDHSVFILYAPHDDPEIAIGVIVENAGYGAVAAGPIASLMAEQYLTGGIADTPARQRVVQRALAARSEPLQTASASE